MFTQPSVNQIASTYQGNPAPLAQKVDTDKKQHGGIPQDLRQLLALNDITQGRNAMGIQQALQTPTNMPTVAQDVQERARQALQARMMQQAQAQQQKNGQPNMVPPGTPRPPMQAQGLDSLESNVGEKYAHGGIIGDVAHFDDGGKTSRLGDTFKSVKDYISNYIDEAGERRRLGAEAYAAQPGALEQLTREEREKREKKSEDLYNQLDNGISTPYPQGGKPIPGTYDRPTGADDAAREVSMMLRKTPGVMDVMDAENKKASTAKVQGGQGGQGGGPRVNGPAQPGGITNALPPAQTEAYQMLTKDMRRDPEAEAAALRAKYLSEVGQKDLSIYDKMAEELKARKERLNGPQSAYDKTMEYLEQIALGGGRTSAQSGAIGASRQKQLNLDRQAQQDTLMEKILDLGAKKAEAEFGEKKGLFEMTQAERKSVYDKAYEAAKAVNASDDKAKELAQQAVLEREKMANQLKAASIGAHDNLMSRAQALMAVDKTLGLEEAMKRAALAAGAPQMEGLDVRRLGEYNKAVKEIQSRYPPVLLKRQTPDGAKMRADLAVELAQARANAGLPPEQGINALPSAGGPTSSNVRSQADSIIAGGR
jgi:hypothetical protein